MFSPFSDTNRKKLIHNITSEVDNILKAKSLAEVYVISLPPQGKCKVTNLYVDPNTGKLVVEYENTPV